MKTVREGWVVFDKRGEIVTGYHDTENAAWWEGCNYRYGVTPRHMKNDGYTCRRVRVTIEELDEKGE